MMVKDVAAGSCLPGRRSVCGRPIPQSMPHPAPAHDAASTPGRIHGLGLVALGSVFSIMLTSPVTSLYLDRLGLPPTHIGGVIGAMSLALIVSEVLALGVS